MTAVVAFITLALGLVLGLAAAFFIGVPDRLGTPVDVVGDEPVGICADMVAAAQTLAQMNEEYQEFIRETYLPHVREAYDAGFSDGRRPNARPGEPIVAEVTAAEEQLAVLQEQSRGAVEQLAQTRPECEEELAE